ncbi:hypothetical protein [Salipiger sp. IMCC34102]|nr:hypothetical protein [Salipiger sp. IMCC34102]
MFRDPVLVSPRNVLKKISPPKYEALHFLGVPEDEIETSRRFSLAHSVNT